MEWEPHFPATNTSPPWDFACFFQTSLPKWSVYRRTWHSAPFFKASSRASKAKCIRPQGAWGSPQHHGWMIWKQELTSWYDIFGSSHDFQVLYLLLPSDWMWTSKVETCGLKSMRSGIHRRSFSDWTASPGRLDIPKIPEGCTSFVA